MGKDGIAVIPVLEVYDVQAHIFAVNILIAEAVDFANTKPGGIQEGDHGFLF